MTIRWEKQQRARRIEIPIIILGLLLFFSLIVIPVSASNDLLVQPTGLKISSVQEIPIIDDTPKEYRSFSVFIQNFTKTPMSYFFPRGNLEKRTVVIINNDPDNSLTNLKITPLDISTDDNRYAIEPGRINSYPAAPDPCLFIFLNDRNAECFSTISPGGFKSIEIDFDLSYAHSGEYTGNLQVSSNTSRVMLPVDIKIKDAWEVPFFVLAFFTFISVLLSEYVSSGKKKDRLRLKIGKLVQSFSEDTTLQNPRPEQKEYTILFSEKIQGDIDEIYADLYHEDYDEAEKKYVLAKRFWDNWSNSISRPIWQDCLFYSGKILELTRSDEYYVFRLKNIWTKASKEFQDTANYQVCETPYSVLRKIQTEYNSVIEKKESVAQDRIMKKDLCSRPETGLRESFSSMEGVWTIIYWILAGVIWIEGWIIVSELFQMIPGMGFMSWIISGLFMVLVSIPFILRSDAFRDLSKYCCNLWPKFWLWTYKGIAGTFLPAIFLIFIGFTQLYSPNPTFGAKGAEDYVTLVFWAFGSGPASAKFVQLVQKFKEPEDGQRGGSPGKEKNMEENKGSGS